MTTEIVLSPIEDRSKDIANSPIWKNAWKLEDVDEKIKGKYPTWWKYQIKFDGLKPIQVTKIEKVFV
ncbi:MAG: hypothetical protein PHF86_00150 [Candidatus Nanoarchaeia archaeon]|nr:hypothetical protein [Candidatus Nanoarchaeia archaeon]